MSRANGYFEAFVNQRAYRQAEAERSLIDAVTQSTRAVVPGSQVRWAGSVRKGTAIDGSDLDLCVETASPVTEANRRDLRARLEGDLGRPARVLSHAVRLPRHRDQPKVDIAFANAAFGSRPLPDASMFHDNRPRQATARALKLWTRAGNLPHLPGWVVEALVVHLDAKPHTMEPLDLFRRVVEWLDEKATPAAIEGVLRPAAFPRWNDEWSRRVPGRLEALKNSARALRRRGPAPDAWRNAEDVGAWLRG